MQDLLTVINNIRPADGLNTTNQWRSHGGEGVRTLRLVATVTSYLVTFTRILRNLYRYFIYPI